MVPWLPIKTERLTLREIRPTGENDVHEYASDPCVSRYEDWGPNSPQETHEILARWLKEQEQWPRDEFNLAVELTSERKRIGTMRLHISDDDKTAAYIGYAFSRRYWNQGHATEAARALIEVGFRDLKLHRIWATCDTRNIASWRVMEKLGLRREAHFVKDKFQKGEWRDSYLYAILANEWLAERPPEQIAFRPLARADFDDIVRWHQAAHATEWFAGSPTDAETAEEKYGPHIDRASPTKMHIVEILGTPIGYLQHYLVRDYPEYSLAVGDNAAAAIDFLIGESGYVGRGLGPRIIRKYVEEIVMPARPSIRAVVSSPDPRNTRSIRALEKAGFHQRATVQVNGHDERLCTLDLAEFQITGNFRGKQ